MAQSLPPLTWIRSFEAAARTLSFTAAAEEIGLTQSAVSQQVKSLELRLGVPLFVRKPRSLTLTDEGRKLLPQVGAALGALAQATAPFGRGAGLELLTVATSVSVAQWLISPKLPAFNAAHPEIKLRLLSTVWPDDFHSSQADVEIRFGSQTQVGKNARRLPMSRLVPVMAPGQQLQSDMPLIETVGTSDGWQAWQATHGTVGGPTIYTDTYGLAMQMAADGNGVALVNELLAQNAITTGKLERAFDRTIEAAEGYYLSTPSQSDEAAIFVEWFLSSLGV